jgi:hypothetical protein
MFVLEAVVAVPVPAPVELHAMIARINTIDPRQRDDIRDGGITVSLLWII